MERTVPVADGVELWVEERGDPGAPAVLLVMGAASSGLFWPDALVDRLARSHRVVRYDHRDTGRSTAGSSYALRELADDAVAVLDGLGIDRAHVVGMSMGGLLTQLLLLDHPDRLLSATLFGTGPLGGAPGEPAPGPSEELLAFWATMGEPRDDEAELAWRVEHWRLLHGDGIPVDPAEWRAQELRVAERSGGLLPATAHATADQSGLERGAELASVAVPVLVVEAPADPAYPPPNARRLADALGNAHVVTVPGMGHALPAAVLAPLADAIEAQLVSPRGAGDRPG
jgi:pimeloyl-ACP methyl ester carboxylesterase